MTVSLNIFIRAIYLGLELSPDLRIGSIQDKDREKEKNFLGKWVEGRRLDSLGEEVDRRFSLIYVYTLSLLLFMLPDAFGVANSSSHA